MNRFNLHLLLALTLPGWAPASPTADSVQETLSGFEEAIRLEERLSREKLEHERVMRVLRTEIDALRSEMDQTRARIEEINSQQTEALEKRRDLVAKRVAEEEEMARITALAATIASAVSEIEETLPEWVSMVSATQDQSAGAVLSRLRDLWLLNQAISTRRFEVEDPRSEKPVQVDLIRFGLGGAFFASPDGTFGGRFVFDGKQWGSEILSDQALLIREAIRREEGLEEPGFVLLPVSVGGGR